MTLTLAGTLPVSAINTGLSAAPAGLQVEVSRLGAEVEAFAPAVAAQALVDLSPPDPLAFAAAMELAANPLATATAFVPATWAAAHAETRASLVAELAEVEGWIAALSPIVAQLEGGIAAAGISGWSYAGQAGQFGPRLATATRAGFGKIPGVSPVSGLVIATRSLESWEAFSRGFEVGDSVGPATGRLNYLGSLDGGRLNLGASVALAPLRRYLSQLEGIRATLQSQVDLTAGIGLPSPTEFLELSADLDVDAAFESAVSVSADLDADVAAVELQAQTVVDFSADISAQLSAGGLVVWRYEGRADGIGPELTTALADGLPGTSDGPRAPLYGLTIATDNAEAWNAFGLIAGT